MRADLIKKGSVTAAMADAAKDVAAQDAQIAAERASEVDAALSGAAAETQAVANMESSQAVASALFRAGERVECRHGGGAKSYPGRVAQVNADGTYAIEYEDGDKENGVVAELIRSLEEDNKLATESGRAGSAQASARDASARESSARGSTRDGGPTFSEGQRIECRHGGKAKYYIGRIARAFPDNTYDVDCE